MVEGIVVTALQQQAIALHEIYGALRTAGFSQSEAIEYLVMNGRSTDGK